MSWPERTDTVPDGRELRATYDGESVGWVVHLVGQEDRPVAARDIHDAARRATRTRRGRLAVLVHGSG